MSGGAFDYLWLRPVEDYIKIPTHLTRMAEVIFSLAPDSEAYRWALMLCAYMRAATDAVSSGIESLAPVFKAVELWESGDASKEDAMRAIAAFKPKR